MGDKYLSASKTAEMLGGISLQTLRNWGESGIIKSSRTPGNHRRFKEEDIRAFLNVGNHLATTLECRLLERSYEVAEAEGERYPMARKCGGFSKSQIGTLLKNQEMMTDEANVNISEKYFFKVAELLSSPYLFATRPMSSPTVLIPYRRVRNGATSTNMVIESENCFSSTYKFDMWNAENEFEAVRQMCLEVDQNCMNDVVNNCHTRINSKSSGIKKAVAAAIDAIDQKVCVSEPKFAVFPPELSPSKKGKKLTGNLEVLDDDICGCQTYVSRMLRPDQILVGNRGQAGNFGYVFCPYLLIAKEGQNIMSMVGKKLLREGAKFYSVITVE